MKLRACIFAFAVTVLAGCGNPYALKTTSIDRDRYYPARDGVAAIELSDPQVFAREALINDRLDQAAYLKQKLEDSKNAMFGPDLIRELTYQSVLAGSVAVTVDPASGFAARNAKTLDAVRQEIELTRLETELIEEQKKKRAALAIKVPPKSPRKPIASANGETPATGEPATDEAGAEAEEDPDAGTEGTDDGSAGTGAHLKNLQEAVNALRLDQKATLMASVMKPQPTEVKSSPREALLDLNAYRDEIRALIAENALDDAHDIRGNSLFRLGFTATVLPGQKLDKWGLISASIEPPKLSLDDLSALYLRWLEHATYRSNDARAAKGSRDRSYELIAAGTGAFALAKFRFRSKGDYVSIDEDLCWLARSEREASLIDCDTITLAVPPVFKAIAERPFIDGSDVKLAVLARLRYVPEKLPPVGDGNYSCSIDDLLLSRQRQAAGSESGKDVLSADEKNAEETRKAYRLQAANVNLAVVSGDRAKSAAQTAVSDAGKGAQIEMYPDRFLPEEGRWANGVNGKSREDAANTALRAARERVDQQNDALIKEYSANSAVSTPPDDYVRILRSAQVMVAMAPFIASSAQGIVGRRDPDPRLQGAVAQMLSRYESAVQDARVVLELAYRRSQQTCEALSPVRLDAWGHRRIPEQFLHVVLEPRDVRRALTEFAKAGTDAAMRIPPNPIEPFAVNSNFKHSVYATRPLELAQRSSTVASAAQALEFAVAAKAALATSGVGVEGGLNYSRAATGKVEALERLPLVVAYSSASAPELPSQSVSNPTAMQPRCSDSGEPDCKKAEDHSFGWILGPKARVDAANQQLVLEHGVSTYPVTADVSVPSWWGRFSLNVDTGWVGNWNDGRVGPILPQGVGSRKIEVRLPVTRADLDALTAAVASELAGDRVGSSRIRNVLPDKSSLCGEEALSVQIYGADIWRSTLVTLDGVEATAGTIRVLPDLEGVTASFSRAALRNRSASKNEKAALVIWSRSGHDTYNVKLTGVLKNGKCVEKAVAEKTSAKTSTAPRTPESSTPKTKLTIVSPKTLSICANTASFAIQGAGLAAAEAATTPAELSKLPWDVRLGSVPATNVVPFGAGKDRQSAIATFDKLNPLAWHALKSIPLTVVDGKGAIATADIALVSDAAACAAAAKASTTEATPAPVPLSLKSPEKVNVCSASAELVLEGDGADSIESAILLETLATMTLDKPNKGQLTLTFAKLPVFSANREPPTVPLRLKAKAGAPNAAKVKPELALATRCEATKP